MKIWMLMIALLLAVRAPARAQSCTASTINGSYGYSFPGWSLSKNKEPTAAIGRIMFSAQDAASGTVTGVQTTNFGGSTPHPDFGEQYSGSYTINSDCTGKITRTFSGGTVSNWDIVVVRAGDEIVISNIDAGFVVSGSLSKL